MDGIHKLPNELLLRIFALNAFRHYSDTPIYETVADEASADLRDIITISTVCHRWRILALSAPELWSHMIDARHSFTKWFNILLERSQPLAISFMPCDLVDMTTIFCSHRVLEPRFVMGRWEQYSLKRKFEYLMVQLHLPRLESLYLDTPNFSLNLDDDESPSDTGILSRNFPHTSSTPFLKHLYLRHVTIRFSQLSSLADNLETLHVGNPNQATRATAQQWLQALVELPRLQHLHLHNALRPCSAGLKNKVLLNLETFSLKDHYATCAPLLDCLSLDSNKTRTIRLHMYAYKNDQHTTQGLERIVVAFMDHMKRLGHSNHNFLDIGTFGLTYYGCGENDLPNFLETYCDHQFAFQFWIQDDSGSNSHRNGWMDLTTSTIKAVPDHYYNPADTLFVDVYVDTGYFDSGWIDMAYLTLQKCRRVRRIAEVTLTVWWLILSTLHQEESFNYFPMLEEVSFNIPLDQQPSSSCVISEPAMEGELNGIFDEELASNLESTSEESEEEEPINTSYLFRDLKGTTAAPDLDDETYEFSDSGYDTDNTLDTHGLYDEIITFCESFPTVRVVRHPPRFDIGNLQTRRSRDDLERWLKEIGVGLWYME